VRPSSRASCLGRLQSSRPASWWRLYSLGSLEVPFRDYCCPISWFRSLLVETCAACVCLCCRFLSVLLQVRATVFLYVGIHTMMKRHHGWVQYAGTLGLC
jgi:hypothetical protein